jgi:8-oxo-dGTP diphosphatase
MLNFEDKFFERDKNVTYTERPCAYAVIRDQEGKIAFVEVRENLFLIGGGMDQGETPEQTIIREAMEEIGARVTIGRKIGEAADYIFGRNEQAWFHKSGTYYEARIEAMEKAGIEPDHRLVWRTLEEARPTIRQQSHIWAIERALSK